MECTEQHLLSATTRSVLNSTYWVQQDGVYWTALTECNKMECTEQHLLSATRWSVLNSTYWVQQNTPLCST